MKIKLSSIYASEHLTAHPGSVIEVSDEEGQQIVDGRFGVEVPDEAPATPEATETETDADPETPSRSGRKSSRGAKAATPEATA